MINQYIKSIGIELECGAELDFIHYLKRSYNIKISADASVCVENSDYSNYSANNIPKYTHGVWVYNAEIKYHSSDYNRLRQFVKDAINESYLWQNSSCGNHIHIKFTRNYYLTHLFTYNNIRRFITMYAQYATTRADIDKYLSRLGNSYCKEIKSIEDVLNNCSYDRYYAVNIQCNKKHKRSSFLEFRLFPYVESSDEYLSNLEFLVSAVTKILQGTPKKHIFKI